MKTSTIKSILAVTALLTFMLLNSSPSMACECIVSGETKSAKIEVPGEIHCYTFWGEAGQGFVGQMADDDALWPPRIQLFDPNGDRVAQAVDESYPYIYAAIEDYQLEMTGLYTIVVSYDGGTSEYGLSLVLTGGTTTSIQDHDGGDLSPSGTRSGTITRGDTDIFIQHGQMGQGMVIQIADDDALWPPRIQLYDPNGDRVAQAVDESYPYIYAAIEDYQMEMTGLYTIVVSYEGGTSEYGLAAAVMPPIDPHGRYPYEPQPADGQSIDYCDPNYQFADVLVENMILPDRTIVTRRSGAYLLSWWSVIDATGYDVYFASAPCMPLEKLAENVADPWVAMPVLERNKVYYWQVVAHTPSGDIQGPTWWFSVETCDCSLMISAIGQGSIVDPNEGFHEYPCEEFVPVTAVADPNYEFVRWEGTAVDANKVSDYQDPTGPKVLVTVDGPYTLTAVFEEIIYEFSLDDFLLDSDPNWYMEGEWDFGIPTGQGGEEHGYPDPNSGYTDPNVFGVNLDGDYDVRIGGPYSLVAGPFDLSGYDDVKLRFARWLNTDEPRYVTASLDVSVIGENWRTLWESDTEITDSLWVLVEYPLGAEADGQSAVYLRWTYQILRERAYPCSGWNLDDIQLCGKRQ